MDRSLPGSSVHGIFQTIVLEWIAVSFSRGSSQSRDWTHVPCIGRQILYHEATRRPYTKYESESVSCSVAPVQLCDPIDCSLPGSSVHGILRARILEEVAIPFSRQSSQPGDQTQVSCIVGRFFTVWATREAPYKVYYLLTLSLFH